MTSYEHLAQSSRSNYILLQYFYNCRAIIKCPRNIAYFRVKKNDNLRNESKIGLLYVSYPDNKQLPVIIQGSSLQTLRRFVLECAKVQRGGAVGQSIVVLGKQRVSGTIKPDFTASNGDRREK